MSEASYTRCTSRAADELYPQVRLQPRSQSHREAVLRPGLVAVFTGMVLSWIMRIHLVWPNWPIPGLRGCRRSALPAEL